MAKKKRREPIFLKSMEFTPPRSGYEPPAAKAAVSIVTSTQAAPRGLLTIAERTDYRETGRYSEA